MTKSKQCNNHSSSTFSDSLQSPPNPLPWSANNINRSNPVRASLTFSIKSFQRSNTELVRAAEENPERIVALGTREPNRKEPTGLRICVAAENPWAPETKHCSVTALVNSRCCASKFVTSWKLQWILGSPRKLSDARDVTAAASERESVSLLPTNTRLRVA